MSEVVEELQRRNAARTRSRVLLLALVTLVCLLLTLSVGQLAISPEQVVQALISEAARDVELAVLDFRLPRSLLAVLVGAAFAISGGVLQGAARNGLADPGVLGIGAGAGLGVMLVFSTAGQAVPITPWTLPIAAFAGGLLAAALVWALALRRGSVEPTRLILVGIGVGLGLGALTLLIALSVDPDVFRAAARFQAGSLAGRGTPAIGAVLPWLLVCIPVILSRAVALDLLSVGDDLAAGLGVRVERERRVLVAAAVGLACAASAVGGAIAFAGLVAPHVARRLVGPRHRPMLLAAAFVGALFVLVADVIGRTIFAPGEIPAGIITGVLGAPYFLYLLRTRG